MFCFFLTGVQLLEFWRHITVRLLKGASNRGGRLLKKITKRGWVGGIYSKHYGSLIHSLISFFYIRKFIKKRAFKCLFKIPMWREIDIATLYFFNISSKNLKWKHRFYTDRSWSYLLLDMAVWWGCISRMGRSRGGEGERGYWWATFVW